VLGERSPESREVTVGLQSTEARLRLQPAGSRYAVIQTRARLTNRD